MARNISPLTVNIDDFFVDLTFHNVPANLLKEFMQQVVNPHYAGNLTQFLKEIMEKAVADNEFLQMYIKTE